MLPMHLIAAVLGCLLTAVAVTVAKTNNGMVPVPLPERKSDNETSSSTAVQK